MNCNFLYCIFFIFLILIIIIKYKNNKENFKNKKKILFSCTTYLALPDKYEELYKGLHLFFYYNNYNSIDKFIIINEYSKIDTMDKINYLKRKFPQIEFIQKNENEKGQAYSLNRIIDILKEGNYDYWIQWEEAWYPTRKFLKDAINIMNKTDIDQLQFTNDWFNIDKNRIHNFRKYIRIDKLEGDYSDENIKYWNWRQDIRKWPLYSLRPCINRVSTLLPLGYFNNSPEKWPVQFEFEYAYKWVQQGLKKGVMKNPPVKRNQKHKSSYNSIYKEIRNL